MSGWTNAFTDYILKHKGVICFKPGIDYSGPYFYSTDPKVIKKMKILFGTTSIANIWDGEEWRSYYAET
jgi:hypothetical protein